MFMYLAYKAFNSLFMHSFIHSLIEQINIKKSLLCGEEKLFRKTQTLNYEFS